VSVYFDTAYVAKCYVNEPDSLRVRAVLRAVGRTGLTYRTMRGLFGPGTPPS
jgi:hypothetical protein